MNWWSRTVSNRRPRACKARALPAELRPRCRTEGGPSGGILRAGISPRPGCRIERVPMPLARSYSFLDSFRGRSPSNPSAFQSALGISMILVRPEGFEPPT